MRELLREGETITLLAISPDSPAQNIGFARKIDADGKSPLTFSLLSDPSSKTIDRYSLRDPQYAGQKFEGIPHPAVFLLDRKGVVRWSKIETDYRQRPSNAEIRAALDSIK